MIRFGKTDICKVLFGACLYGAIASSCGSADGPAHKMFLKFEEVWKLKGSKPGQDRPLDYCKTITCAVFDDQDVRKMEKYVVGLELKVKELEGKCK